MAKPKKKSEPKPQWGGVPAKPADPQLPSPPAEVPGLEPEIAGKRPVREYKAVFSVEFGQFFLQEEFGDGEIRWAGDSESNRFDFDDEYRDSVAVGTIDRYASVTLALVIGSPCPQAEIDASHHVVECPLVLEEGRLRVGDAATAALRVELPAGTYRVCVLCHCSEERHGIPPPGVQETYKVYMWPAEYAPPKVVKRESRL